MVSWEGWSAALDAVGRSRASSTPDSWTTGLPCSRRGARTTAPSSSHASCADGTPVCVHDGSGWLNVSTSAGALVAESVEHGGPDLGHGTAVVRRGVRRHGRDRPQQRRRRSASRRVGPGGDVTELDGGFNGVHGQVSMVGDRVVCAALRAGTPTQIVVIDADSVEPSRRGARAAVGGWDVDRRPWPRRRSPSSADGAVLHARRYPATASARG